MSTQQRISQSRNVPIRPAASPPPLVRTGAQAGGQLLDRHTQARMSSQFGHDFSQVRIHTDARASDTAAALGANAYAHGSDIVFGSGKYTPGSPETERLLAHELTHVVQQSQHGPGDPARASRRSDASEQEADSLADSVTSGQSVDVQAAPGAAVARDTLPPDFMTNPEVQLGIMGQSPNMTAVPPSAAPAAKTPPWMKHMGQMASLPARPPAAPSSSGGDGMSAYDVITDNGLGTGISAAAGLAEGTRLSGPLGFIDKANGPLGMYSNAVSFGQDIRDGNYGGAVADAAGFGGSAVATAGSFGLIETGAAGAAINPATLTPWGAAAGSFAGGYATGSHLLNQANGYAKRNAIFGYGDDGEALDSTEKAANAGRSVDDAISDFDIGGYQLPGQGLIGGIAGGVTATAGSWLTAGYSGLHAALSGPSFTEIAEQLQQREEDKDKNQAASDAMLSNIPLSSD